MGESSTLEVVNVRENSPYFDAVLKLWRKNSDRLGFFPAGAFSDCAMRGMLVAAVRSDQFVGYAAYRVSGDRAILIHLCVSDMERGKNAGRALVENIKQTTKMLGLRGIGLSCRADYEADGIWPRFGFSPRHEKAGKKKDGSKLKFWWFDYGLPDLFSLAAASDTRRIQVAIDANVFYDLHCERPHGEESRALEADWLESEIELCVTDEIYNEIDRNRNSADKAQQRLYVERFRILRPDERQCEKAAELVKEILGIGRNSRDVSDRAHLIKAAASGAAVFLTRDDAIRQKTQELHAKLGIRALAPLDLITELDEIRRQPAYQPAKMAESHVALHRLKGADVDGMQSELCAVGEDVTALKNSIRALVAVPTKNDVFQVVSDGSRLAVIAFNDDHTALRVPLARILPSPLMKTLAHHISIRVLEEARRRRLSWIKITDPFIGEDLAAALTRAGFFRSSEGAWRISAGILGTMDDVLNSILKISYLGGDSAAAAKRAISELATQASKNRLLAAGSLEQLFWPAKVTGEGIASWIVPIQRKWAQHLVDPSLAKQELFGADPFLALNREHVYYRSKKPPGPNVPGRVLWYVSKDTHQDGTMRIRACSRVVDVSVGAASNLFQENKHLGVYIWPNVRKLAKGDPHAHVMAFRFADTEVFSRPIPLAEIKSLGVRSNFPSPVRISDDLFATIYRRGMQLEE